MWARIRDLALTVGVLLLLIAGAVALPFFILLVVIVGLGFLIYAYLHDRRIAMEEHERIQQENHRPE